MPKEVFHTHEEGSKTLKYVAHASHAWFIFNLDIEISSLTHHKLQRLHII
jgi:hypothetical protein